MRKTLERHGDAPLNWRLHRMNVGDELLVPYEVMPFAGVYNYAKSRASSQGFSVMVYRAEEGTIVKRTSGQTRVDRAIHRPGQPGKPHDWGTITRQPGQKFWRLPFSAMEVGDVFRLHPEDYPIAKLRSAAATAAWKHGKHFKVSDSPLKAPGRLYVECVGEKGVAYDVVAFGVVDQHIRQCYVVDDEGVSQKHAIDWPDNEVLQGDLGWAEFKHIGQRLSVPAKQIAPPPRSSYVFKARTFHDEEGVFAVDLYEDRIEIERVTPDMTMAMWEQHKQDLIEDLFS